MSFITDHHESPAVTFAEPGATRSLGQVALDTLQGIGQAVSDPYVNPKPYGDLFWAAERSTRLTGNVVSESASREEAYDRRIKAIKAASGMDLENPERGGYQIDARRQIAQEVRAGGMTSVDTAGGIPEYQRRIFDQKVAELQKARPDLSFGDLDAEARQIAHGSSVDLAKAATAPTSGPASLAVQFAGGVLGSRRDPIFIGSMLAGPETAAARTVFGRIAGAAMRSGLYNAGISAMEQPAVQAWREKIGLEHGIVPAIEDVGFAFGLGLIPGAVVQGIKEGFRAPMGRVLAGHPEPGDIEAVKAALPIPEREAAALKAGEESVAADRATLTIQPPKGVPEPLHDDMMAAALKRADQPDAPSPEAVEAVKAIEAYHGSPHDFDAFRMDRVGSGEGAQSYGHGLYFAENPAVAKDYQKILTVRQLEEFHKNLTDTGQAARPLPAEGALYQVRIHADQEKMLDWDKPLSDQSEFVRNAIENLPQHAKVAIEGRLEERGISTDPRFVTGRDLHEALSSHADRVAASKTLQEVGIPGIKYFDRGSRPKPDQGNVQFSNGKYNAYDQYGAFMGGFDTKEEALLHVTTSPSPTRNFVIFNDKDVEITHKNGQSVQPPIQTEVAGRITEAAPKSEAEAHAIADQALDDIGRREGMGSLRDRMGEAGAERAISREPPVAPGDVRLYRGESSRNESNGGYFTTDREMASDFGELRYVDLPRDAAKFFKMPGMGDGIHNLPNYAAGPGNINWRERAALLEANTLAPAKPRGDVLDKVPWVDDAGNPKLMTAKGAAAVGERETTLSMLVRSCK